MCVWNGREYKFLKLCSLRWVTNLSSAPFLKKGGGYTYISNIYFYDRNPAGKELDFDSNPEQKEPFTRYVVSFQLENITEDLFRLSLPTLSDISHGIVLEMKQLHRYYTPARKALNILLRSTDSLYNWVPEQVHDLLYDTGRNRHLGDNRIISPVRV